MSEAPKRIWVDAELDVYDYEEQGTQPYIRADIVDELVAALKICLAGNGYDFDERPAEAALAKLEESHD